MTDLTVGKPWTVLWKFSLPMFVSVIFQQMYSIFDSIIAGKFAGEDALAAVGASYPITTVSYTHLWQRISLLITSMKL